VSPSPKLDGAVVSVRSVGAVIVEVALILMLLGLLPQTLDLGTSAGRFPIVTTVVLLGLLTLDLVIELVPAARRRLGFLEADYIATDTATEAKEAEAEGEGAPGVPQPRHREFTQWSALAWLTAVGVGMYYLGYLATTPIFLAAFFLWSRVPLKVAVGITLTLSAFNYLVFFQYLGLR
jgi:hypothetical protein